MNSVEFTYKESFKKIPNDIKEQIYKMVDNVILGTDPFVITNQDFNCHKFITLDNNLNGILESIENIIGSLLTFEYIMYIFYEKTSEIILKLSSDNELFRELKLYRYNYIHDTNYRDIGDYIVEKYVNKISTSAPVKALINVPVKAPVKDLIKAPIKRIQKRSLRSWVRV
jgi:hypothetical protein